ncbi:hypothetical protein AS032_32695 [Rhodococcus qingshengii]|jgi:hypothetical protein|nr:hypothetical protein AOT96_30770 [Rhodococcus sp. 008]ARE37697.1 hypothetical protein A0W34_29595 [Rhodococcus sp. BH4]KDQ04997.1 hypothetical protein EN35_17840 [Rhodococcus qingshengii]KSU65433.1 hypothetical protein AS032_32695 [Rhodococcus qingshengii]KZF15130.1 hypothetical protein A2J01_32385 [Rhodococcus sp. EPR-134]
MPVSVAHVHTAGEADSRDFGHVGEFRGGYWFAARAHPGCDPHAKSSDLHLLPDNAVHHGRKRGACGCVERIPMAVWAKPRNSRVVPLNFLVMRALDLYLLERTETG